MLFVGGENTQGMWHFWTRCIGDAQPSSWGHTVVRRSGFPWHSPRECKHSTKKGNYHCLPGMLFSTRNRTLTDGFWESPGVASVAHSPVWTFYCRQWRSLHPYNPVPERSPVIAHVQFFRFVSYIPLSVSYGSQLYGHRVEHTIQIQKQ